MKTLSLLVIFTLSCMQMNAQDTILLHLDENYNPVQSKKAVFLRKVVTKDDHYVLIDQYTNGQMIYYGEFISVNPFIEDGLSKYYQSGKLLSIGNYSHGKLAGKWIYVNGNYHDTVDYSLAETYYKTLKDSCNTQQTMPKPINYLMDSAIILEDLQKFIKHNFHFPSRARDISESLHCNVRFYMDTKGHIKCPEITDCINVDFMYELLRILFLYQSDHILQVPLNISFPFDYDIEPSFVFVEKIASFQSGNLETFRLWVQNNLVYPKDALDGNVSGRITVQFAVTPKGEVVDVKILNGVSHSLDKEAYHVVLSSPKWDPAQQNKRAVRQQFVFPVIFRLPNTGPSL